jgi:hypothetical protein
MGFTPDREILFERFTGYPSWYDIEIYFIFGAIGLGIVLIGTPSFLLRSRSKRKKKK